MEKYTLATVNKKLRQQLLHKWLIVSMPTTLSFSDREQRFACRHNQPNRRLMRTAHFCLQIQPVRLVYIRPTFQLLRKDQLLREWERSWEHRSTCRRSSAQAAMS